ncbi:MAG: flagellar hook-basal body complex protein FliE [Alphaproteobacteria bacterium]|nr:flagellar hook-basal body complex protein FliE [Alphaproteobacteria bacterium]
MAIAPAAAASAYQAIAKIGTSATPSATSVSSAATPPTSFAQFLDGAVKDALHTVQHGENMAAKDVQGKASMVSVVNAVNNAELTLDTVVAVRDKVISAYQSIMQMPI